MTDVDGCPEVVARYAAAISNDPAYQSRDPAVWATGLMPGPLWFQEPNCRGYMWPTGKGGSLPNWQSTVHEIGMFGPESMVVPARTTSLVLRGNRIPTGGGSSGGDGVSQGALSYQYRELQVAGPVTVHDLRNWKWSAADGSRNLIDEPPTGAVNIVQMDSTTMWAAMCQGQMVPELGGVMIEAWRPQQPFCDRFMVHYCADRTDATRADACACIWDAQDLETQRAAYGGVHLPVLCFGTNCLDRRSYRTLAMLQDPCHVTVCQQIIQNTAGTPMVSTGGSVTGGASGGATGVDAVVYCGGSFYSTSGTPVPSVSDRPLVTAAPQARTSESFSWSNFLQSPSMVWILLGGCALMFLILVMMMFAPMPKKKTSRRGAP